MIKMTADGKRNIEARIEELKKRLQEIRVEKSIAYTATGDTWHDNPYFNKLEADERAVDLEIIEALQMLSEAEVIEDGARNVETVEIGSIVKCHCRYSDFEETLVLEIVGHGETDIDGGKILYESPVAQSLLGHHVNDVIPIRLPNGSVEYKILKFYADWDEVEEVD